MSLIDSVLDVDFPNTQPNYSGGGGAALGGFSCYPDCSQGDRSVPIYQAYNHHYFSQ